ncbi:AraC family transcriptional regulator [Kribbella amoyensis]|uniref:AraC family transcriptional regulator n=1 Tax=Kribbella amoyensis TaxID=996641 RepID=A0A561BYB8_9ACTN|nr:helix-turn-helix domain-containing protein [Kribbella amoyensis]TWD83828.1 AraC family transcriptional regulator [Kribbella amoyensis]
MDAILFESDDLDRTEEFLSAAYTKVRIGSDAADSPTRIRREQLGPVTVDSVDIGFELSYVAAPMTKVCLCGVESGTIRDHATDGWTDSFGPGDMVSLVPPERPYSGRVDNARYSIVLFDPELLDRVAEPAGDGAGAAIQLLGHRPVSAAAGRQLRSTIRFVSEQILDQPEIRTEPLIVSNAAQLLAASVLTAFGSTAATEPTIEDRHDARPATLRRAIAFLEENPRRDIAATDIADAAGVTLRAVQIAFRRHLDTTPMGYLRRLRLAEAHRELVAADPGAETVAGIGARWGFCHAGRFAAEYRSAYGRQPSASLSGETSRRPARA